MVAPPAGTSAKRKPSLGTTAYAEEDPPAKRPRTGSPQRSGRSAVAVAGVRVGPGSKGSATAGPASTNSAVRTNTGGTTKIGRQDKRDLTPLKKIRPTGAKSGPFPRS